LSAALIFSNAAPNFSNSRGLLLDTMLTINPWVCGMDPRSSIATGWAAPETLRVQASRLLHEVHGRFSEGSTTGDLRQATTLLEELA